MNKSPMDYLPLFFDLKGQQCLIVGGGDVAYRKADLLVRAGAKLRVVSPEICDALNKLVEAVSGEYYQKRYDSTLLADMTLVISATDDVDINQQVSIDARVNGLPVNVVDNAGLSNFIVPAIVDRSPIMIAVSSGGKSPILVRLLRGKIESMIPATYGLLCDLVGRYRDQVKSRFSSIEQRRSFWEIVLQGPISEMVFAGKDEKAEDMLKEAIASSDDNASGVGEVYLVGGGPGDPDLLTFKALRLMQQADVVVYDRLVSTGVVDLCRRDAERIYVGKARSNHAVPQEEINDLLVRLANAGKRVLRLKGGDPFIFGRGGEEIEQLMVQGIPFQVVPGITSASGCAAYAGIPLTHRDYAQSVRFVTGHLKDDSCNLPWHEMVSGHQTIVIYMGLITFELICENLISHGMDSEMPVALVEKGTLPEQRVVTGTLSTISSIAEKAEIKPPALVIVGEVVKLREKLNWYGAT